MGKKMNQGSSNRGGDRGFGIGLLPPEVMEVIMGHCSVNTLKAVRLVDRTWSSLATAVLQKVAALHLSFDAADHLLADGAFGVRFKALIIHFSQRVKDWATYGVRVLEVMTRRGETVERLTLGAVGLTAEERTAFLTTLFSSVPNVQTLRLTSGWSFSFSGPLPVLQHCKTIILDENCIPCNLDGQYSQQFLAATPNVERILRIDNSLFSAVKKRDGWLNLKSVSGYTQGFPYSVTEFRKNNELLTLNRPLTRISIGPIRVIARGPLLLLMEAYKGTLQVLEMSCVKSDYQGVLVGTGCDPAPVMGKLRSLSLLNCNAGYFVGPGFLFGDALNEDPTAAVELKLSTHFPVLETLRFTIRESRLTTQQDTQRTCLFFLNYFPILLDQDLTLPTIRTLELNWPDADKDIVLWHDWTRRVASMFPNVAHNPHVLAWKKMKEMNLTLDPEETKDEVQVQWEIYEAAYAARDKRPSRRRKRKVRG